MARRKKSDRAPKNRPLETSSKRPNEVLIEDDSELLDARWEGSRSGATAGRGFHFQDAVGALLAAKIAVAEIEGPLTPEGFDDMTLEAELVVNVQIKSRQGRLGPFPTGKVSEHIVRSWLNHAQPGSPSARLVVVCEGGVSGAGELLDLGSPLLGNPSLNDSFFESLRTVGQRLGLTPDQHQALVSETSLVAMTWSETSSETTRCLSQIHDMPLGSLRLIEQLLRSAVASASDANAESMLADRRSLERSEILALVADAVAGIDVEGLEQSISEGICAHFGSFEPFGDESYYEGHATQPGHARRGLVVPRPELLALAPISFAANRSILFSGASGVGKSAVLWMLPAVMPGVLWFTVGRLQPEDVPLIMRLCIAHGASVTSPVGLLVDAAGIRGMEAWPALQRATNERKGIYLAGSVRAEDLSLLGDMSSTDLVSVELNEQAAETIHRGLKRRGATQASHWKEAFQESSGLTLEFIHMLTSGGRLEPVVRSQVEQRIQEERFRELEVLSLVAVADMWSASVPLVQVAQELSVSDFELRSSISRLLEEHLIAEQRGSLVGLHQLRSTTVAECVHGTPPPELSTTVKRALSLIPPEQIHTFVVNMLRDNPALAPTVEQVATDSAGELHRLAGFLQGLRLFDFDQIAREWVQIAVDHDVHTATQSTLFMFASADLDMPEIFPDRLREAREAMAAVRQPSLRNQLLDRLGDNELGATLSSANTLDQATILLVSLGGVGDMVRLDVAPQSPLGNALRDWSSIDALSSCLAAARAVQVGLARKLLDLAGGAPRLFSHLRTNNPWITELELRTNDDDDEPIAFSRLLYISREHQGDPSEAAHGLGRQLVRCLPDIAAVDIQALAPGGHAIEVAGHVSGVSRLQRGNEHATVVTSWNQAAMEIAHSLIATTDTERLAPAGALLADAESVVRDFITLLLKGRGGHSKPGALAEMDQRRSELHERAVAMRPSIRGRSVGLSQIGEATRTAINDDLSELITSLTGNALDRLTNREGYVGLASYLQDTIVAKHIPKVREEPWHLIGTEAPSTLDDIESLLTDAATIFEAIAAGDVSDQKLANAARAGSAKRAVERAAETAGKAKRRRTAARRRDLRAEIRTSDKRLTAYHLEQPGRESRIEKYLVTMELEDPFAWIEELDDAVAIVEALRARFEQFTFVPVVHGRVVQQLAMSLISTLLPNPSFSDFPEALDVAQTPLTDAFDGACSALSEISSLAGLDPPAGSMLLQSCADGATERFKSFRAIISELGDDALVLGIGDLIDRWASDVQDEHDGEVEHRGFAESVVVGALQHEASEVFAELIDARLNAMTWDLRSETLTNAQRA